MFPKCERLNDVLSRAPSLRAIKPSRLVPTKTEQHIFEPFDDRDDTLVVARR